ncbi:MAG: TetR/AcrR family transcriptional regulator [Terriglobales bacterium]
MLASRTAQRIANTARRLLDRGGAEAVTMRRVASAVGITAMAVYRHYPGRDGLLNAVADKGFEELAAHLATTSFSGSLEERLSKMAEIYLDHALENPRLFELMFLRPRQGARKYPRDFMAGASPTANLMAEVIREGIQKGYFRKGNAWEIVFEMGALSHGLIMLFLGGRMAVSKEEFRAFYQRAFWRYLHGICN